MEKAVVDRFEGNFAVLLVGDKETKLDVPRARLPKGVKEGDWLKVEIANGDLIRAKVDMEETQRRKERILGMMEKLRHKSGTDRQT